MRMFNRSDRWKKSFSVITLYAILIQQILPFGWVQAGTTGSSYRYYSTTVENENQDIIINAKDEVEVRDEVEQLESVSISTSSGGGQAEASGFSIGSTDGMVDKFTGDFSYSIPLMNVEGYPLTLSYSSNVAMNSEASWVGLGWDLSVGAVSREMRGIPDEFNGEQEVVKEFNQLDGTTDGSKNGFSAFGGFETGLFGDFTIAPSIQLTALWGSYTSPYTGVGKTFDFGLQSTFSLGYDDQGWSVAPTFGLGYSRDTKNGIGTNSNIGISAGYGKKEGLQGELGATFAKSFNSRVGLTSKSISTELQFGYGGNKMNGSSGTGIRYGTSTMVPSVTYRSNTSGVQTSTNISATVFYGNFFVGAGGITQSYEINNEIQTDASSKIYQPAIGYFHSGKRDHYKSNPADASYPIMDFNRGTRNEYSENMAYLDFSAQTYDIFRVNSGSLRATFRGRRSDVGTYYDAAATSETDINSHQIRLGVEVGGPVVKLKLGYSFGENLGDQSSGNFTDNGVSGDNILEFVPSVVSDAFDRSVYFKSIGESTPEDMDALYYMGGEAAVRFNVEANATDETIDMTSNLMFGNSNGGSKNSSTLNNHTNEIVRAAHFIPRVVSEFSGQDVYYRTYSENDFNYGSNYNLVDRTSAHREGNHLSSMEAIDASGMRYIYDVPAYEFNSAQTIFSADKTGLDATTGLVTYTSTDNSVSNSQGRSNLFERTTIPSYAHSFLLTQMLSSDYADRTGDGPSIDDVGTYYKFNYTQVYGEDSTASDRYKWRFPVAGGTSGKEAFFDKAALGSDLDDKANYSYGEKEIWYVHSIEGKNMIAEFYLEDRLDAYGVTDKDGTLNLSTPLKRIQKIVLYNRSERINNVNAEPIQTVEFEYDYSLCKNAPSNKHSYSPNLDTTKSGKLTLKAIRVYAGSSEEMALSSYEFDYGSVNPEFNYADIDGWGNYKDNDVAKPNDLFPYADQTESVADQNAKAWKLTKITNPTGGTTEVTYESDRYAYVEQEPVMKHFEIHGMTDIIRLLKIIDNGSYNGTESTGFNYTKSWTPTELENIGGLFFKNHVLSEDVPIQTYANSFGEFDIEKIPNNVIIFELQDEYSNALSQDAVSELVQKQYFKRFEESIDGVTGPYSKWRPLYFKIHSEIDKTGGVKDYVPFFANISNDYNHIFDEECNFNDNLKAIGVLPNQSGQNYKYGYVVLEPAIVGKNMKDQAIPIKDRIMAHPLQKAVLEYARMNLPDVLYGACVGCTPDLSIDQGVVMGKKDVNRIMIEMGYASNMVSGLSSVRLTIPDSTKFGGNGRVKQITYSDDWNSISEEFESTYTWKYEYPGRNEQSGVASNEARGIRDENPLYFWGTYQNVKEKFPDESKFMPLPVADLLYPSAVIGYERVEVRFLGDIGGYSETNFHTAKEHPTRFIASALDKSERVSKKNIITGATTNLIGMSQGYTLITNDFHGRMKSAVTYDGLGNKQAQSIYEYYDDNETVKMIDREGQITDEVISTEYDMHSDANFASNLNTSYSLGADLKLWLIGLSVSPVISLSSSYNGFWSNTFVKHINKSAVVKNVQSWQMQSVNNARNIAFDKQTGNVIISQLQDEYDDTLYSFAYPSHWYYDQFRSTSEVEGFKTTGVVSGNDLTTTATLEDYFVEGDELEISNGSTTVAAWILKVDNGIAVLIDEDGYVFDDISGAGLSVEIMHSGRDNRLGETMQSAVSKKKPDVSVGTFAFPEDELLSISAMSYRDRNNMKCRSGDSQSGTTEHIINTVINPYPTGIKGKLVADGQYSYQSERVNATHEFGTRFDGQIDTVVPFYKINAGEWYKINESNHPDYDAADPYQKWRQLGETKLYDQFGKPLESADQIDIHSAVIYGYDHQYEIVPIAQAVNARKQEIAFDGFEDYDYYQSQNLNLQTTHFNFADELNSNVMLSTTHRHSGLSSLKILPENTASVTKLVGQVWTNPTDGMTDSTFIADSCLCIPPFAPTAGDYIIGGWVKVGSVAGSSETYVAAKIEVVVNLSGSSTSYPFLGSGPIIDGWQRVEGNFTIPSNAVSITVNLENDNADEDVYFDDLRIHPFLAGMTTTVYDPKTLLPLATHDGYNFTTFYNYDENLNQVRVRVETTEGIKTISESEVGGQKRFE